MNQDIPKTHCVLVRRSIPSPPRSYKKEGPVQGLLGLGHPYCPRRKCQNQQKALRFFLYHFLEMLVTEKLYGPSLIRR